MMNVILGKKRAETYSHSHLKEYLIFAEPLSSYFLIKNFPSSSEMTVLVFGKNCFPTIRSRYMQGMYDIRSV